MTTDADKAAARWVLYGQVTSRPSVETREILDRWMNELHCYLTSDVLEARAREVLDDE